MHTVFLRTPLPKFAAPYTYRFFRSQASFSSRATTRTRFQEPLIKRSYHSTRSSAISTNKLDNQPPLRLEKPVYDANLHSPGNAHYADVPRSTIPTSHIIEVLKANAKNSALQDTIHELISNKRSKKEFRDLLATSISPEVANLIQNNLKDDISAEAYDIMSQKLYAEVGHGSDGMQALLAML